MSEIQSELYQEFADKVPGISKITLHKLDNVGIDTIEKLKNTDWKNLVALDKLGQPGISDISYLGEDKIVKLYEHIGINLDENEVKQYRKDLLKHKVSAPQFIETKTAIIPPQKLTEEEMTELADKAAMDITTITQDAAALVSGRIPVKTNDGKKIILTLEEQKFKKVFPTTDMENFVLKLGMHSNPEKYLQEVRSTVLNSLDKLVDTGARAHVKQWINLLEKKIEGRKVEYSLQKMNTPKEYRDVLEKLLDNVIAGATDEIKSGNITFATQEILRSQSAKEKGNILPESIMHTIILYKIYVDAKGSGWDAKPKTGQLGVSIQDGEEFYRRMKEISPAFADIPIKRTWSAYQSGLAVLLSGMPGSGKTTFAKACGDAMTDNVWNTLPFTRINITGGLEPEDILGGWDYQAQILALTASKIRIENIKNISEDQIESLRQNIYTIDYFKFGPLALSMIQGVPILIDEVNRGSADIQNTLLQAIDENEIVIPGIGRIRATPGFFVVATINEQDIGTTELGQAFLRRLIYIYFEELEDYTTFVKLEYPNINSKLLKDMEKVRKEIKKTVTLTGEIPPSSISAWVKELINLYGPQVVLDKQKIIETLGTLLKNKADIDEVRTNIDTILKNSGVMS
ncbi:MAG: MoxR family ATPase [Candidatus Omnitrophota bacterium]